MDTLVCELARSARAPAREPAPALHRTHLCVRRRTRASGAHASPFTADEIRTVDDWPAPSAASSSCPTRTASATWSAGLKHRVPRPGRARGRARRDARGARPRLDSGADGRERGVHALALRRAAAELSRAASLNIGCDETFELGKGRSRGGLRGARQGPRVPRVSARAGLRGAARRRAHRPVLGRHRRCSIRELIAELPRERWSRSRGATKRRSIPARSPRTSRARPRRRAASTSRPSAASSVAGQALRRRGCPVLRLPGHVELALARRPRAERARQRARRRAHRAQPSAPRTAAHGLGRSGSPAAAVDLAAGARLRRSRRLVPRSRSRARLFPCTRRPVVRDPTRDDRRGARATRRALRADRDSTR